ncbi:putative chitinase [Seiridium unicorne]|uniref:chitinase n=1 Tax=Seiridium unicorne TaxID=138068 RepID=A0ABR2VED3_9PEZI
MSESPLERCSDYASAETCPLNVCCSEYGFCGTTTDFCGDSSVAEPVCSGSSATQKTIAYYEGWNLERACQTMEPEDIPIGGYTHINFAFLYIDPDTYTITPMEASQEDLYSRVVALKKKKDTLEVWISIGGRDFNDPGSTQTTFADIAASTSIQSTFFTSLLNLLDTYGFDGVDLDWEYPGADDRGGSDADFDNYVSFLANLRDALDSADKGYGLTLTLPSSYWYLKHFDVVNLAKSIDWFNMMTYDLHGGWNADDPWIGSVVNSHTNLTEIQLAMDLLWRNDIDPAQVVMGLGFYGRSTAGPCTANSGTLSFSEIEDILNDDSRGAIKTYDSAVAVQIVVYDTNQWVSYDDWQSFEAKMDWANSHCLGGTMVWAVSLDSDGTATNGLTGATSLYPGDDGSSGGTDDIYIGPDLWTNETQEISCDPPCTLILPPFPLATPVTITWPEYETTIASSGDGTTYTVTTTISIAPFEISEIPFWPITVASSTQASAFFSPTQSITPPSSVMTLPGNQATFPMFHTDYSATLTSGAVSSSSAVSTPAAMILVTELPKPMASLWMNFTAENLDYEWNPAVGTDCSGLWSGEYYCVAVATSGSASSTSNTPLVAVFYSTSHPITIVPQATATSIGPPGTTVPIVTFSRGDPPSSGGCSAGETLDGCGSHDCSIFGCSGECGFFGCDGGCGLGFCGGGGGLLGCGPGCGDGACLVDGGGGGGDSGEESSTSESRAATATPTTTTVCDTACAQETSSCATLCTTLTYACEPTAFGSIEIATLDDETWDEDQINVDEDAMNEEASSAASWLNPLYTSWDPILISSTTYTASGTTPSIAAATSTKSSSSSQTAISVTSCGTTKTVDGSSTSTYCTCNGGFAVDLSTKTNAAHTTFMICGADPALTISTITPTSTSTKTTSTKTTTTMAASTQTGQTCDSNGDFNFEGIQPQNPDNPDIVQISGTYNKGDMVTGTKAKFCGQTSSFTIDGDNIKGSSGDDSYGSYTCEKSSISSDSYCDSDNMVCCTEDFQWDCLTDICL